jgi:hypothetical protein
MTPAAVLASVPDDVLRVAGIDYTATTRKAVTS